jgi:hypothetical protein
MKKIYIFLAFIICCWGIFSDNVYYIEKDGTVLNLGKNENARFIENREVLENGEKFYKNGREDKEAEEKIRQSTENSKKYFFDKKISDEVWASAMDTYIVTTYDIDEPYKILEDVKIFGGLNGGIIPEKYLGYLVLKDSKVYHTDNVLYLSDEETVNAENIDLESLEQKGNNYFKDKNGIYSFDLNFYFDGENENIKGSSFKKVKNADAGSFQVLTENYAKDSKNIYYKDKKLSVKDVQGFQSLKLWTPEPDVLTIGYSKDGIYYEGKKISSIVLKGKAEIIGKTIFKDDNQVYIAREYHDSKLRIEKRDIPVNAEYTGWILDDEKYLYDPYLNGKIEKDKDFKWLDEGNLFQNNEKIYFISPMFGITEQKYNSKTFRLVYEDNFTIIAEDKNGYYVYGGDSTGWQFEDIKNEKISLLNDAENVTGKLFYNKKNKKYYFLLNPYKGEITELTGIKHVSEVLGNSYIIGN